MKHTEVLAKLEQEHLSPDNVFSAVRAAAYFFQNPESEKGEALDLIIRLIERRKDFEALLKGVGRMIDAIAREAGLYPYMEESGSWHDELAIELMRAPGLTNIVFHIEQAIIFHKLAQGRSIILSAPTSFGKSLLIDALITYRLPNIVVAVVPTIALLDEFRRRMVKRFPQYQIISQANEAQTEKKAIFIGTQERLLERTDITTVDLFVIDEFYKLDFERNDQRSLALNAVLARYGTKAKQIYFLGPSIDDVPNRGRFRSDVEFIKTRYSPVTADIIDRTAVGPSPEHLISDLRTVHDSYSLVYVRSPEAAWKLAHELLNQKLFDASSFCGELGEWLRTHYHPEWILGKSVAQGIGIHHGRVPRAVAHLLLALFNKGSLSAILCTSSMIEGVNTAAENVFIYDRHISSHKLDRFTFDNIKGRAGRLFKHKIGKIYLYNSPPDEAEYEVRISLFENEDRMVPELLVQLEDSILTPVARQRKKAITDASVLAPELLARWAEFGVDPLNALADELEEELRDTASGLYWKGIPDFDQVEATFDVVWGLLRYPKHGIRTPKQLAHFANVLRRNKSTRGYMDDLVHGVGLAAQREIDLCFNFMRGSEYTFPQVLRALNDVIDTILGEGVVDYRVYANQLQNLFLPGELRVLDEYGVPLPLVEMIIGRVDAEDIQGTRESLERRGSPVRQSLSQFENAILDISFDMQL